MPQITIRIASGREPDELKHLVAAVSEAAASSLELPIDRVTIHIFELDGDHVAKGGRLISDAAD